MRTVVKRESTSRSLLAEPEVQTELRQLGSIESSIDIMRGSKLGDDKQKEVLQRLVTDMKSLGLTINEVKVYLCLIIHDGGMTGSEMSRKTGIQRTESYTYLSQLMTKGLVNASFDRPTRYHALPIANGIKSMSKAVTSMLDGIALRVPSYVTTMSQLAIRASAAEEPRASNYGVGPRRFEQELYQHLSGARFVISKLHSMLISAEDEVEIMLTPKMLSMLWYQDMDFLNALNQMKVPIRIVAAAGPELKKDVMSETDKVTFVESIPTSSYVIIDDREVLAILESEKVAGLWTTNKTMMDIILAANKTVNAIPLTSQ